MHARSTSLPNRNKNSSSHHLKILLPKIAGDKTMTRDTSIDKKSRSPGSRRLIVGKSVNVSKDNITATGFRKTANTSKILDGLLFDPTAVKTEIGHIVLQNVFDQDGEVTSKIILMYNMTELAISYANQKLYDNVLLVLDEMETNCLTYHARALVIAFYKCYSTVLLELSEYSRCNVITKKLLNEAHRAEDYPVLLTAYENLGEANAKATHFEDALRCFFLMLKVALRTRSYMKELAAYDKIGLMYFNLNQMDRGEYFHVKMLEGRIEKEDSGLRKLQFVRHNSGPSKGEIIEDDLQDLAAVFFEPMAVDVKYRGFDEARRKIIAYMDEVQNPVRRVGNVKVYASKDWANDPSLEKLSKASYGKKPTNCPLSSLAHYSANRSVRVYDSVCSSDIRGNFRFLKFGKQIRPTARKLILKALLELKEKALESRQKVVRAAGLNSPTS
jgi:tetratricopeptide (TPR) repeat protein